jgi:DNA-binding CsgD family transcriptional regulator
MSSNAYLLLTNVAPSDWLGTLCTRRQTIGRGEEAELRIPSEYVHVSRSHAVVWTENDGHWIIDLGSKSGTRVNNVPLAPYQPFRLMLNDHLWLGAAQLDLVANPHAVPQRSFRDAHESTVGFNVSKPASQAATIEFSDARTDGLESLTPAELDVVLWISRGLTDPNDVANSLYRSPHTVRSHLSNIYSKLNVHSRDQLLACLIRRGNEPPPA